MYIKHCYMKVLLSFTKQCHAMPCHTLMAMFLNSNLFHATIIHPLSSKLKNYAHKAMCTITFSPLPSYGFWCCNKAMPNQTKHCHGKLWYIISSVLKNHAHKAMQLQPCNAMLTFNIPCLFMLCKNHAKPHQKLLYLPRYPSPCAMIYALLSVSLANPSFKQLIYLSLLVSNKYSSGLLYPWDISKF